MYYPDEIVEEVRSRNNIVDLIGSYVKLTKRGSSYVGLCPFHNERTPSFHVSADKQMYYCFGCGAGGSVFTFLMEYENDSFTEAVQKLADRAGIKLPVQEASAEEKALSDRKTLLMEINKEAAKYYYCKLRSPQGQTAMRYLKKRGLSDETIKQFGLGYADKFNRELYQYLKNKGYQDEALMDSGLFTFDENRGVNDKFWNRVMFPIMDTSSRVIAFGGRVMGDAKPKYLNSPETKIFDKSRNLYGLHRAKSSREKNLIICEGYMDVISMHQAGFTNAVASLGTAFTSQQASLLKRYTSEVLVMYDSDGAGIKAAMRAIPMLRSSGLRARVVNLEPHKDPDEFILSEGIDAFRERLEKAENSFLFEIRILQRDYDLEDPDRKTAFFQAIASKLLQFEDELERNNYLESISKKYSISSETLRKQVNKQAMKGMQGMQMRTGEQDPVEDRQHNTVQSSGKKSKDKISGKDQAQKLMLTWIASYPSVLEGLKDYISPEDFMTPLYRLAAERIWHQAERGSVNPAEVVSLAEDLETQNEIAALFHTQIRLDSEEEQKRALWDVVCGMKEQALQEKIKNVDPTDMKALQSTMAEKKRLEQMKSVGLPDTVVF